MNEPYDHHRISPTAKLIAFLRQRSDIPYAADVARIAHAEEAAREMFGGSGADLSQLAPAALFAEARYKSMVAAIRRENISQVLELASGLAMRGVALTEHNPRLIYVETDLPGMHEEKLRVLAEIFGEKGIPYRPNLFFQPANILEELEIDSAAAHFREGERVAIVHEGLFQYLPLPEKERAARNIHNVLRRFGGVWITPDLETRDGMKARRAEANEKYKAMAQTMVASAARVTGRDFAECAFDDDAHVDRFLADTGFTMECIPQVDDNFVFSCMGGMPLPQSARDRIRQHLKLWIMRPKQGDAE